MNKLKTEIKTIKITDKWFRENDNFAHPCCQSARSPAEKYKFNKKYPVSQESISFNNLSSPYLIPKSDQYYYRHPNS